MDHQGRASPNHSHVWWWKRFRQPTVLLWIHYWPKTTKFAWHPTISCILSIICCSMVINSHWCNFLQEQPSLSSQVSVAFTGLESFQQLSFKITFLGEPLEGIRWQSSTKFVLTGAPIGSKTSSTFFSISLSPTSAGMPDTSRHSLLQYCSLAWHLRSRTVSLSVSLSFTFLEMCRSDSSLQNLVFSSFRSFFGSS